MRAPTKKEVIIFMVSFVLLLLFVVDGNAEKGKVFINHDEWIKPSVELDLALHEREEVLKAGDNAVVVLSRLGFPMSEATSIIQAAKPVYSLKNIYVGRKFVRKDLGDSLEITYPISATEKLRLISKSGQGWQAVVEPRQLFSRTVVVKAVIQDSLFWDAAKAGLEDSLTMKLVDMFAWDIDFARDLRKGDAFKVMFEESFDDEGKRVSHHILAAEFVNKGKMYTGVRFENKNGEVEYYSVEGQNLRKTYLKSPVKYSRISSRFSTARKHPVLGYTRAHRGVDYAAKSGTPIRAIGDGKVVFKGWKGGYGRFIEIRHNNGIHSTAYAHMRRYGKGMRKGKYVRQGQVIGYVGMSGLATGPHLHFEFRSRGRAVNPLKIKYKPANPVAKGEMTAFRVHARNIFHLMTSYTQVGTWG